MKMRLLGRQARFPFVFFKERRKAERLPIHETLYLDYYTQTSLKNGAGEGKDISTLGIQFSCGTEIPLGTLLNLALHFYPAYARAQTVQIQSRVVRCSKQPNQQHYRIACVFDPIEDSDRDELTSFLLWLKDRIKNPYR